MTKQRFEMKLRTHWEWEHFDKEGHLKGRGEYDNLVVTAGLNGVIDAAFKTGLQSPAWYVGLVDGTETPAFDMGDIMGTHAGWIENTAYSEGVRQAFVPGDIAEGEVDNTDSRAVFTVTEEGNVAGFFICDLSTGDTGILFGEGAFASGTRPTEVGDSLRVAATISA